MSAWIAVSTTLTFIADHFFSGLVGRTGEAVTENLMARLQGNSVRDAFKYSLGAAVQRYASIGTRLELARPLLKQDGLLSETFVISELTHIILFDREPDAEAIGQGWINQLDDPPTWRNFAFEAKLLIDYIRDELRATSVFRPVFDSQQLASIAVGSSDSSTLLSSIESQLEATNELLESGFGSLARAFSGGVAHITEHIYDYNRFISEKTYGFVGRKFVFDALSNFTETNPRGYFIVRGDPGIGKSSLAAEMIKRWGYVHHFNIKAEGINKSNNFLTNVCAQLIAKYQLEYTLLPPESTQDAGFLTKLLNQVADQLQPGEKAIIVVDALDEVETVGLTPGVNPLYLPLSLPLGVYIVVTMRKDEKFKLRIDCEQTQLFIEQDSAGNIADVRTYVEQAVERPTILAYISVQNIDRQTFIGHLVAKSQGNFMYLRYVLPEIESGAYKDLRLDAIPVGLQNYYNDHWRRMRGQDEEAWFKYKLPIVVALTVVKEPVSIDLIADFSKVQERPRIRAVLTEWGQFLHEDQVEYKGSLQKRYRVYHASFHDFIAGKEEVADERVDLKAAHAQIATTLWKEFFGHK